MNGNVIVAGNLLVDHVREISRLPARGELTRINRVFDTTGGCVCNTGVDLKILDPSLNVRALGVVGGDADGSLILDRLGHAGLDTSCVLRRGVTSFTDVFAEPELHCRTFYTYGGASDTFSAEDVTDEMLDGVSLFHVGYLLLLAKLDEPDEIYGTKMANLLHRLTEKGIATSVDVVSENSERFAKIVTPALKYTDYFTVNEIEAGNTVGLSLRDGDGKLIPAKIREAAKRLKAAGVRRRVIIHAPEGAWGLDEEGNFFEEPSRPLPKGYIAGSTGAGDAFCAGVLAAVLRGYAMEETLVCGNAAAQVSLRSDTATGSMTSLEEAVRIYSAT